MSRLKRCPASLGAAALISVASVTCKRSTLTTATQVTDSAGISIVVNKRAPAPPARWRTEPAVAIGRIDGPDEYTFGRIADVGANARGEIYVLDRQARRATVYGPDGRYRYTLGGPGEGPGELGQYVTAIRVGPRDSIAILDFRQRRLNVYAPGGEPARTVALDFGRPGPYDFVWFDNGRLLIRWLTYNLDSAGHFVPWDALLLSDRRRSAFDTLLVFRYRPPETGDLNRLLRPIFPNTASYDVLADGRIVWSALRGHQVAVHNLDGSLERIVRNEGWRRRVLGPDERSALEAVYRAGTGDRDAPIPDNVVFPDSIPAITAVRASPDGGFWVQRMGALPETDPEALFLPADLGWLGGPEWEVYDSNGYWYATVELPRRFRVTRVRDSTVIGIQRDDLDVETVMVLRLLR